MTTETHTGIRHYHRRKINFNPRVRGGDCSRLNRPYRQDVATAAISKDKDSKENFFAELHYFNTSSIWYTDPSDHSFYESS